MFSFFFPGKTFSQDMLLDLIEKTKQTYVFIVLTNCVVVITSFDLWISKEEHDIFALVVNFLREHWASWKELQLASLKQAKH
jgi:hypothetical protein